jgi:uncharacterized membrane protein
MTAIRLFSPGCEAGAFSRSWRWRVRIIVAHEQQSLWAKAMHIVFVARWLTRLIHWPRLHFSLVLVASDGLAKSECMLPMKRRLRSVPDLPMALAAIKRS